MSVRASNWAWGLQCVSGTTKLVLMALADCANHEGACWPSNDTISEKAVASATTVRRAIKQLEQLGLIVRLERKRADGSQTSNVYYLQVGKDVDVSADNDPQEEPTSTHVGAELEEGAVEENTDISSPGQNGCPPDQVGTPALQDCAGRGAPVTGLEPPTNHFPPLPPKTAANSGARAEEQKGRKSRRRTKPTETPVSPDRQRVFVEQYSPQWEAWRKHRGKGIPTTTREDPKTGRYKTGWYFDTEWPPERGERS